MVDLTQLVNTSLPLLSEPLLYLLSSLYIHCYNLCIGQLHIRKK